MANRWGKKWKQWQTLFSWAPKSLQMVTETLMWVGFAYYSLQIIFRDAGSRHIAYWVRICNSSAGILSLPGASARNSAHDKGHEEGGSAYAKLGSSLRSPPTSQFKSINSSVFSFLYGPTLTSIPTTGKTIALTRWTFVGKVMSLLLNMLSSLVIVFFQGTSVF